MSMRLLMITKSASLLLTSLIAVPSLAQSPANAGKQIVCQEDGFDENTGEDVTLGRLTITLGKDGKAVSAQLIRPKHGDMPAINALFVSANAPINHRVEKNDFEIDEVSNEPVLDEAGKKQYKFGIENVEAISLKNSKLSATILINDHLYAGRPGSVLAITMGDKLAISAEEGTVSCTGAVMFPMARPEDSGAE